MQGESKTIALLGAGSPGRFARPFSVARMSEVRGRPARFLGVYASSPEALLEAQGHVRRAVAEGWVVLAAGPGAIAATTISPEVRVLESLAVQVAADSHSEQAMVAFASSKQMFIEESDVALILLQAADVMGLSFATSTIRAMMRGDRPHRLVLAGVGLGALDGLWERAAGEDGAETSYAGLKHSGRLIFTGSLEDLEFAPTSSLPS